MAIVYTVFCSELQNTEHTMAKYTVNYGYTAEIWEFLKCQLIIGEESDLNMIEFV